MKLAIATLSLALLVSPVLANEGWGGLTLVQEDQPQQEQCVNPEHVTEVFKSHNMEVRQLAGPELASFNAAYVLEYKKPMPDVDLVLLVERGTATQVFSFKEGCLFGQGKATTAEIHKLLGAE